MQPLDTGLAPDPRVFPPPAVTWRLAWSDWLIMACLWAVVGVGSFCGSYELKSALGIDLIPGYHLQDALPFYPR